MAAFCGKYLFAFLPPIILACPVGCTRLGQEVGTFSQIVLLDVQGLFGGQDLWLSSDGKAVCRFVGQGVPQETRFEFEASREQLARLRDALQKHDFSSIRTPRRDGVPDEAHPKIFVVSGSYQVAVANGIMTRMRTLTPYTTFCLKSRSQVRRGSSSRWARLTGMRFAIGTGSRAAFPTTNTFATWPNSNKAGKHRPPAEPLRGRLGRGDGRRDLIK